jgi:hypothetical protein
MVPRCWHNLRVRDRHGPPQVPMTLPVSPFLGNISAKARARGYRIVENFITIAYVLVGKLCVNLSHITNLS